MKYETSEIVATLQERLDQLTEALPKDCKADMKVAYLVEIAIVLLEHSPEAFEVIRNQVLSHK